MGVNLHSFMALLERCRKVGQVRQGGDQRALAVAAGHGCRRGSAAAQAQAAQAHTRTVRVCMAVGVACALRTTAPLAQHSAPPHTHSRHHHHHTP